MDDEDNDGRFPDESPVEVLYPAVGRRSMVTASGGRGCQEPPWSSAARTRGMCVSRSAS